jgi:hypothetical protein
MDELDELDHAVALALGGELDGDGWRFPEPLEMYSGETFIKTKRSFCRGWEYGGPIIEREGIWLTKWSHQWSADVPGEGGNPDVDQNPKRGEPGHVKGVGYGPTPLIAAMRAFVASKR